MDMSALTSLLDVSSGGIFSAIGAGFGLLGGWLAKKEARKMKELDHAHEEKMASIDLQMQQAEHSQALAIADKQLQVAETEGKIAIESGELAAFQETIKQQGKMTGHLFFDGLKSSIRPLLTVILLVQLIMLQNDLAKLMGGLEGLPQDTLVVLYIRIIDAVIFLATTAMGWWFGSRRGQI